MALKFLNKKGWHTGSLRNIENVWKAEQKHDAEQKKLEELRKQIHEERERSEFRLLQQKAGLLPAQERLEFLYDSGLSVGNSEGFQALEAPPKPHASDAPSSSSSAPASKQPGALFEEKPQSANDAWRKLHSDPLLMIRQREQQALARIKNNPIKMAIIQNSVKGTKPEEKSHDKKERKKERKKHRHSSSKHHKHSSSRHQSDSEDDVSERRKRKESPGYKQHHKAPSPGYKQHHKAGSDSEHDFGEEERRKRKHVEDRKYRDKSPRHSPRQRSRKDYNKKTDDKYYSKSKSERHASDGQSIGDTAFRRGRDGERVDRSIVDSGTNRSSQYKRRNAAPKLSEEERAAKLKQMQLAAELHEEQRWKRLKKEEENDAKEVVQNSSSGGRNFLDAAHKSVYGAAEGGSSSIAESVRRRTHYSQGRSDAGEGNAFRR